jgi:hypothetical protein
MIVNIKEIIKQIPDELSDIERVRYLYLKCGELFAYNRDYIYSDINGKSKELYEEKVDWNNIKNKNKNKILTTCNQIATGCTDAVNILESSGNTKGKVFAKNVGYVEGEEFHIATIVNVDDKTYFLDLYKDLYRIQKGMKTKYFAPSEGILEDEKHTYPAIKEQLKGIKCTSIPEEELMQMDKKCGYNRNGIYMDDALIQLKKEMDQIKDINDIKKYVGDIEGEDKEEVLFRFKLDFINKYLMNSNQENNLDIKELTRFYIKAYYTLLSEKEINERLLIPIDIHYKGEPSVLFDIYTKKEPMYYLYKGKEKGFERISDDELSKLENNPNKELRYDSEGIEP